MTEDRGQRTELRSQIATDDDKGPVVALRGYDAVRRR